MLEKMVFSNFRGIRHLELEFNEMVTVLAGENGTYKTTVMSGFFWCPTGKDHLGRQNFEIKTIEGKRPLSQIDHAVELHFSDFGLKRVYREDWKQRRGASEKEFRGHETDLFLDLKNGEGWSKCETQEEFYDHVKMKLGGDMFFMLSSPTEFAEKMNWKDRRKIVFDVVGDVLDGDVLSKMSPTEAELIEPVLRDGEPENLIDKKRKELNEINKELVEQSVRIDEATKNIPHVSDSESSFLKEQESLKEEKKNLTEKLEGIKVSADLRENLEKAKREKTKARQDYEEKCSVESSKLAREHREKFSAYEEKFNEISRRLSRAKNGGARVEEAVAEKRVQIEALEKRFLELKAEKWEGEENCHACGKRLDEDKIGEAVKKWKNHKAEKMKEINSSVEKKQSEVAELKKETFENPEAVQKELDEHEKTKPSEFKQKEYKRFEDTDVFAELDKKEREALEAFDKEAETLEERKKPVLEEIESAEGQLEIVKGELAKFGEIRRINERIKQLRDRQHELSGQYTKKQSIIAALESFLRAKADLMEGDIYKHFGVKFRMYEWQINGGIKQTCEVLTDCLGREVPFSASNNAMRINTGIKICDVLQKYYGFDIPIFVDNAESVTKIEGGERQIIQLAVSREHKILTKIRG